MKENALHKHSLKQINPSTANYLATCIEDKFGWRIDLHFGTEMSGSRFRQQVLPKIHGNDISKGMLAKTKYKNIY